MARLPRLAVPGHAHLIVQRAHGGLPVLQDPADRQDFLAALRDAAASESVAIHAYAFADSELLLLATPHGEAGLGRMMQSVARRYVSAYNRRHGRRGTLWEGRYRCGVVEPGRWLLAAMLWIDGQAGLTSAKQRTGVSRDTVLVDPAEFWALGNTPFDREAAYRMLLVRGLPTGDVETLRRAAEGGWAIGSEAFVAQIATQAARPAQPRARGRPRRSAQP